MNAQDILDKLVPSKSWRQRGVYRSSGVTSINTPLPGADSRLCLCCDCDTVSWSDSSSSGQESGGMSQMKLRPADSYSQWETDHQVWSASVLRTRSYLQQILLQH